MNKMGIFVKFNRLDDTSPVNMDEFRNAICLPSERDSFRYIQSESMVVWHLEPGHSLMDVLTTMESEGYNLEEFDAIGYGQVQC